MTLTQTGFHFTKDRSLFIAYVGRGGRNLGEVSLKTLEESRGRTTQISLENEDMSDMWGQTCGGDRESHQKLLGGITSVK